MRKPPSKSRSGFSFVEVIVSMMLVSIGMVGAMGLASYMSRANQWSERTAIASTMGQDKLEELLNTPYAALQSGSDSVGGFSRAWTVTTSNNFRMVTLRVTWDTLGKSGHEIALSTVRPNPASGGVVIP